jgi:hypothetical protein
VLGRVPPRTLRTVNISLTGKSARACEVPLPLRNFRPRQAGNPTMLRTDGQEFRSAGLFGRQFATAAAAANAR